MLKRKLGTFRTGKMVIGEIIQSLHFFKKNDKYGEFKKFSQSQKIS